MIPGVIELLRRTDKTREHQRETERILYGKPLTRRRRPLVEYLPDKGAQELFELTESVYRRRSEDKDAYGEVILEHPMRGDLTITGYPTGIPSRDFFSISDKNGQGIDLWRTGTRYTAGISPGLNVDRFMRKLKKETRPSGLLKLLGFN